MESRFRIASTFKNVRSLVGIVLILISLPSFAAQESAQTFTLDGKLYSGTSTTTPLASDPSVVFKVQILSSGQDCVLYEEQQTSSTDASGNFTINIGSRTGAAKRTSGAGADPGNTMAKIFQNTSVIPAATGSCAGDQFDPTALQSPVRYLKITVTPSTTGIPDTFATAMRMDAVPNSWVAESIQGYGPSDLLLVRDDASYDLNQNNLESIFTVANFAELTALLAGTSSKYMTRSTAAGASLPSYAGNPTTPAAGSVWYDSTSRVLKYHAGVDGVKTLSAAGSIDGSSITSGTIGGTTSFNSSGDVTAANMSATSGSFNNLKIYRADNTKKITITALPGLAADYGLVLPADAGTNKQLLQTDGSGNLTWASGFLQGGNAFGAAGVLGTTDNFDLSIKTNNADSIVIKNNNTVGIGTNAPNGKLEVRQASGTGDSLVIHGGASTVTMQIRGNSDAVKYLGHAGAVFGSNTLSTNALGIRADDGIQISTSISGLNGITITTAGDVGVGTVAPGSKLHVQGAITSGPTGTAAGNGGVIQLRELAANGTNTVAFKAPDSVTADRVFVLPDSVGSNGQALVTDGSGNLSWASPTAGGVALSSVTAAGATNTIANANFAQIWNWDTLTTQTAMTMASNSMTSGNVLLLSNSNNSAGSTGNVLKVNQSGTSNASTGLMITNAGTGASLRINDDGTDTDTTPVIVDASGQVGIGTALPSRALTVEINGNTENATFMSRYNSATVGSAINFTHIRNAGPLVNDDVIGEMKFNGANSASTAKEVVRLQTFMTNITSGAEAGSFHIQTATGGTLNSNLVVLGSGDVGIGTTTPGTKLDVVGSITSRPSGTGAGQTGQLIMRELAANGTNTVTLKAPDTVTSDRVFVLPDSVGSNGQALVTDGSGNLSWASPSASGVALSGITAATATNTINNVNYAQVWNWNSLTTENAMTMGTNSMTTGNVLLLSNSNNSASSTGNVLKISQTGVSNASVGLMITNSGTGNSLRINDDGTDTDSSPVIVDAAGNVGIGTTAATTKLEVHNLGNASSSVSISTPGTQAAQQLALSLVTKSDGNALGQATNKGWQVGARGDAWGTAGQENVFLLSYWNGTTWLSPYHVLPTGEMGIGTNAPGTKLDVVGSITSRPSGTGAGQTGQLILRELAANGTNTITVKAADSIAADQTFVLPASSGSSGQALTTDGSGNLSWSSPTASGVALSGITAAGATNTINNVNYAQVWNWNSLTTENAMTMASSSMTTGNVLSLTNSFDSATSTGNVLKVTQSGTTNASVGLMITNAGTGASLRINDDGTDTDSTPFIVDSSGKVGIGVQTPSRRLHVKVNDGAAPSIMIERANNTSDNADLTYYPQGTLGTSNVQWNVGMLNNTNNYRVGFYDGSGLTNVMTITNTARVGIGTSTPGVPLHVVNPSTNTMAMIEGFYGATTTGTGLHIRSARGAPGSVSPTLNNDRIGFLGATGYGATNWGSLSTSAINFYAAEDYTDTAMGGYLTFETTPTGTTGRSERMRILADGKVGIGTTGPNTILDVAGAITSRPSGTGAGQTGQLIMRELAANGFETYTIKAPDSMAANYTWVLPNSAGSSGQALTTDGSGNLSWTTVSGSAKLSALAAGDATNTINSANFAQVWNWNSLTTETAMTMASNSMTTGNVLALTNSYNNATSTGNVLKVTQSGTSNASVGMMITNAGTGASLRINDDGTDTDTTPVIVDATGKMGIGTNNPSSNLTIAASDTLGIKIQSSSTGQYNAIAFAESNGAQRLVIQKETNNNLGFWTATGSAGSESFAQRMVIDTSGRVGIGTDAPGDKLSIRDNVNSGVSISVVNPNAGASAVSTLDFDNNVGAIGTIWVASSAYTTTLNRNRLNISSNDTNADGINLLAEKSTADIRMYTGGYAAANERMRILSDGKVGIGTDTPGTLLDVAGSITSRPSGTGAGQTGQLIMRELAASGTNTFTIKAPDTLAADRTWVLPTTDGSSGNVLTTDGSGNLSWGSGGGSAKLSALAAGDATNTINSANFAQVWNWNSLTTETAMTMASNSMTTGNVLALTNSYNNASSTGNVLKVTQSGTSNASVGMMITNAGTGESLRVNDDGTDTDTSPFVITSTGTVGIGTAVATAKLELAGSFRSFTGGAGDFTITHSGLVSTIGAASGVQLAIQSGGAEAIRIDTSGKTGIGTATPGGLLHLYHGPQWSSHNYGLNLLVGGTRNNAIGLLDSGNGNPWAIVNNAGALRFSQMPAVGNTATGAAARMSLDTSGNMGIGTDTPLSILHVQKDQTTNTVVSVRNNDATGAGTSLFQAYNDTGLVGEIGTASSAMSTWGNKLNIFGYSGHAIRINTEGNDNIEFVTGTTSERMTIKGTGEVGIGSTVPTEALDVVGNIKATGRIIAGATSSAGSLASITASFASTNMIALSNTGACGTLNFTNVATGGSYTVTMVGATSSCTTIQLNGAGTNVKVPSDYSAGAAVSGIVYTAIYDGTTLWVSPVPF